MSVDVGELLVSIAFDTIDMKKGIDQANGYLSSFSGKLTAVTNAVEAQTSIMSVAMDALGNNFQQATKSMIESNKNASDSVAKMGDSIKELGKSIETSATRNKEAMQKQTKIIREESKSAVDSIREMAKKSVADIREANKAMHDSTVVAMNRMATARETMAGKMESGMKAVANSGETMAKSLDTSSEKVSTALSRMRGSVTLSLDGVKKAVQSFASANAISMTAFSNKVQEAQAATIGALREIDWAFQHLAKANTRAADVLERSSVSMINALRNLKNFANTTLKQLTSSFREFESSITKISGGSSLLDIVNELRKVQQEIMKTNDLLKNSAINVRNVGSAGAEATGALSKGFDHASYFTEGFMGKIRMVVMDLFFLQMAAQQAFGILNAIFGQGIKFAAEMETSIIGMAAVMSSTMTLNDADIPFVKAMEISKLVIEDLKVEALRTTATLEELMTVFQAILGPATQMGMSLTQIKDFTVFGANAVKSLGLNHQQLVQELRSIVTDNITTRGSTLATALGITGTDIENAKNSAEGVFGFLEKRMKGFQMAINETAGTFSAMLSNIQDGLQQTQEQGFGRLFKYIKSEMGLIQNIFFQFERHTADVFDDAGKKIFSKGDMKVETVQLNQNTVAAFATLAKITSDIYFDIKNFVTELFNSETTAKTLHNVFYSLVGVVRAIYQNIYQIATLFATWTIVSGNLATKFFALVVATGNLERLLLFVQNHIVGVVAAMITWQTLTRVVGFAFTFVTAQAQFLKVQVDATSTSMQILAARAAMLRSVMTAFAPIMSSIIMLAVMMYTAFNGVDSTLAFIKEHVVSIGIAFAGWNIAMLIAPFSAIGAAIVAVISVVAILLDSFGMLGNVIEFIVQSFVALALGIAGAIGVIATLVIVVGGLAGTMMLASLAFSTYWKSTLLAAGATVWATTCKAVHTIATTAMSLAITLSTPIINACTAAMTLFGIASLPIAGTLGTIAAALLALLAIILAATAGWYGAGAAMDWVKDKWNSLTGGIWANNSALEENIRLQQAAAQFKSDRAYLTDVVGLSEEYVATMISEGDDISKTAQSYKTKQREDTKRLLAELGKTGAKYADPGDGNTKKGNEASIASAEYKVENAVAESNRLIIVAEIKEKLKQLDDAYANYTVGLTEYLTTQAELNKNIIQVERQAIQEKKENAEYALQEAVARGDNAKALQYEAEIIKLTAQDHEKLIAIDRNRLDLQVKITNAYKELNKELTALHATDLKDSGNFVEAAQVEFANKYEEKIKSWIRQYTELIKFQKDKVVLSEQQLKAITNIEKVMKAIRNEDRKNAANALIQEQEIKIKKQLAELTMKEYQLNKDIEIGVKTQFEAEQELYEYKKANAQEMIRLKMEEIAMLQAYEQWNGQNIDRIMELKRQILDLQTLMPPLEVAFRKAFRGGLSDALNDIITNTKSARDAIKDFGKAIMNTFSRKISDGLALKIEEMIFGKTKSSADGLKEIDEQIKTYTIPAMQKLESATTKLTEAFMIASQNILGQSAPPPPPMVDDGWNEAGGGGVAGGNLATTVMEGANRTSKGNVIASFTNSLASADKALKNNEKSLTSGTAAQGENTGKLQQSSGMEGLLGFTGALAMASGNNGLMKFIGTLQMVMQVMKSFETGGFLSKLFGGKADGGYVSGAGTSTSDSIPTMLSNGEFVVRAESVRKIGVNTLNSLNQYGTLPALKFANGGYVGGKASGGDKGINGNQAAPVIKIEVHNETGVQADAEVKDMKFDGEQWVMGLWLRGVAKNTLGARDLMKGMK